MYDQSNEQYKSGSFLNGVPDGTKLTHLVIDRASDRRRNTIDRRFDGTPERRTRDYHLYIVRINEYGTRWRTT